MRKIFSVLTAVFICMMVALPVLGGEQRDPGEMSGKPLVVDGAGLFSSSEKQDLSDRLEKLSRTHSCEVIILTTDSMEGKSPEAYADDYFDENDYGCGPEKDGVLLCVSMGERKWAISTSGLAIGAFTDAGISYIGEEISSYLSEGDYFGAFDRYAALCDDFLKRAEEGQPYDTGNMPSSKRTPLDMVKNILISLVAGLVPAGLVTGSMKSAMKPVRHQAEASVYVKQGGVSIIDGGSHFIRKTITHVPRPKSRTGGGGSSTHSSSSGRTHGGGSGSF